MARVNLLFFYEMAEKLSIGYFVGLDMIENNLISNGNNIDDKFVDIILQMKEKVSFRFNKPYIDNFDRNITDFGVYGYQALAIQALTLNTNLRQIFLKYSLSKLGLNNYEKRFLGLPNIKNNNKRFTITQFFRIVHFSFFLTEITAVSGVCLAYVLASRKFNLSKKTEEYILHLYESEILSLLDYYPTERLTNELYGFTGVRREDFYRGLKGLPKELADIPNIEDIISIPDKVLHDIIQKGVDAYV